MSYKIFTLSPGSTSTKLAVFEDDKQIFKANVTHDPEVLKSFTEIKDQLPFRKQTILDELAKAGIDLKDIDAYSAYSGGLVPMQAGFYAVDDFVVEDSFAGRVNHPAILGAGLIYELAAPYGKPCFINPPDADEFEDLARITGIKGVYRECRVHILNQKEVAMRYAAEIGKEYEEGNFIVAHVGGGLSVSAQKHGRIVDSNDVLNGSGPMAPNRSGTVPAMPIVKMCFSGKYTEKDMKNLIGKTGGLIDHLGTDDTRKIEEMIHAGSKYAKLIYDAMAYQLAKEIGALAVVMDGKVDGIVLTGGVSNDEYFVENVRKKVDWIAPVKAYGGDFEMEALAAGAIRCLKGEEKALSYTADPVFKGFEIDL
ncbi:MAG: butyrate kinase [Erysipelotrichaceae bacterium]|nr:butyrate kinase [Erysipelotrichaceae bacterium]